MNFLIHILIETSQIYIILLMLNECLENNYFAQLRCK